MQMSFGGVSEVPAAKSGADGRFELKGVPAGDWAFTAKAPGRATEVVDPVKLVRDTRPDPVDVVLSPGAAIAGFVLRKTGRGRRGLLRRRQAVGQASDGGLRSRQPADRTGRRVLSRRPEGRGDLRPSALRRRCGVRTRTIEEGNRRARGGRRVDRRGAGRIEGVAVDGRTGQPLTSFEVSFQPDRPGFGGGAVMRMGRRGGGRGFGGAGEAVCRRGPGRPLRPRGRSRREVAGRRHGEGVPGRPGRRRGRRRGDDDGRRRDPRLARKRPEGARHRREIGPGRPRGDGRGRGRGRRSSFPGFGFAASSSPTSTAASRPKGSRPER